VNKWVEEGRVTKKPSEMLIAFNTTVGSGTQIFVVHQSVCLSVCLCILWKLLKLLVSYYPFEKLSNSIFALIFKIKYVSVIHNSKCKVPVILVRS
jgi:hypothetical protein